MENEVPKPNLKKWVDLGGGRKRGKVGRNGRRNRVFHTENVESTKA